MKKAALFALWAVLGFSLIYAGEKDYTEQSFARLNFLSGRAYVQRAADLGFEEGVVNMPIAEGDRFNTTDGRAEIYMGNGAYLRLDERSKMDFQSLPRRSSELTRLHLWAGNTYLSVHRLEKEKAIEIHTADVSLYILDHGLYRIDVRENRETEIFVFKGMAEAAGEGGSVLLRSGERLEAIQGYFTSSATSFTAAAIDSFDRWSEYREDLLGHRLSRRYMPEELMDFEYELASQGRWTYMPPYGNVWIPQGIGITWRPYLHGRWIWYPLAGWTWLPHEPWGWVTCHYGRWRWHLDMGWYWIPTTQWGPAWVSWYVGMDTYGWAPLTYYNRPAVILNNHFYADYSEPDYPQRSRALTVVTKKQLSAPDISRASISRTSLSVVSRIRMSRSAPDPDPALKQMSIQPHARDEMFVRGGKTSTADVPDSPRRKKTAREADPPSEKIAEKKRETRSPSLISRFYNSITKNRDTSASSKSPSQTREARSDTGAIPYPDESISSGKSTTSRSKREPSQSIQSVPKSSAGKSTGTSRSSSSNRAASRSSAKSTHSATKSRTTTTRSSTTKSTTRKKKK